MLLSLREIICVCASKEKQKRFFLKPWDIHKNYYNWFDNSKIIRSLSCDFSLQRKRVFRINIYIYIYILCDCYFGLLILLIISFGTQQTNRIVPHSGNETMNKLFDAYKHMFKSPHIPLLYTTFVRFQIKWFLKKKIKKRKSERFQMKCLATFAAYL